MLSKDKARGAILGYYVLHRAKSTLPWENKTIDEPGATSLLVEPLNEHTTYEFAMQAFNSKGVSKLSALMEKTTDQDGKCYYTYIFYNFYLFHYLFCFDFYIIIIIIIIFGTISDNLHLLYNLTWIIVNGLLVALCFFYWYFSFIAEHAILKTALHSAQLPLHVLFGRGVTIIRFLTQKFHLRLTCQLYSDKVSLSQRLRSFSFWQHKYRPTIPTTNKTIFQCVTIAWRVDASSGVSYRQQQIYLSDCDVTAICGKIQVFLSGWMTQSKWKWSIGHKFYRKLTKLKGDNSKIFCRSEKIWRIDIFFEQIAFSHGTCARLWEWRWRQNDAPSPCGFCGRVTSSPSNYIFALTSMS